MHTSYYILLLSTTTTTNITTIFSKSLLRYKCKVTRSPQTVPESQEWSSAGAFSLFFLSRCNLLSCWLSLSWVRSVWPIISLPAAQILPLPRTSLCHPLRLVFLQLLNYWIIHLFNYLTSDLFCLIEGGLHHQIRFSSPSVGDRAAQWQCTQLLTAWMCW